MPGLFEDLGLILGAERLVLAGSHLRDLSSLSPLWDRSCVLKTSLFLQHILCGVPPCFFLGGGTVPRGPVPKAGKQLPGCWGAKAWAQSHDRAEV